MSLMHRVKAIFWWCHMNSEDSRTAAEKLATMPTDDGIDLLYRTYSASPKREGGGPEWGDMAVWEEFHHKDPLLAGSIDGLEYPFHRDTRILLWPALKDHRE